MVSSIIFFRKISFSSQADLLIFPLRPHMDTPLHLSQIFEDTFEELKLPFLQTSQLTTHSDPSSITYHVTQETDFFWPFFPYLQNDGE